MNPLDRSLGDIAAPLFKIDVRGNTMAMSRALCAMLLLALAGALEATSLASGLQQDDALLHSRSHYKNDFRSWMAENGVAFSTKGEFERRLQIFAQNR